MKNCYTVENNKKKNHNLCSVGAHINYGLKLGRLKFRPLDWNEWALLLISKCTCCFGNNSFIHQVLVVQRVDNTIQWINYHPVDCVVRVLCHQLSTG